MKGLITEVKTMNYLDIKGNVNGNLKSESWKP